ncbi:MAG: glycoside hydrolase family 92 protein, partial [Alistipes sp.]|nr:glycoside hydrolase family 92 protein [Alistipes sp.]
MSHFIQTGCALLLLGLIGSPEASLSARETKPVDLVQCMMGTGGSGRVIPMAAAPFGMVQLSPDTYLTSTGYHYSHDRILVFSHTHASGCGGTDYQDIMFFPVNDPSWEQCTQYPQAVGSRFS